VEPLAQTVARLSASSRRTYQNPYEAIEWPDSIERPQWFTSPELISMYGTPRWDALDEPGRQELSFWEAVNFFSLNIHGEKALMEGLAQRLYRPGLEEAAEYLHHFLDEENKHSVWFGTFCTRYAGKVYPDRKVAFGGELAEGEEDFMFFARVAIFEEIVDRYNVAMGRDDRLVPVVRQINAHHHAEETRHLIFGRRVVEHLWRRHSPSWSTDTVADIRRYLADYLVSTWREYYNPDVYADAGVDAPWVAARETWEHPATQEHRRRLSRQCLTPFLAAGILDEEPDL